MRVLLIALLATGTVAVAACGSTDEEVVAGDRPEAPATVPAPTADLREAESMTEAEIIARWVSDANAVLEAGQADDATEFFYTTMHPALRSEFRWCETSWLQEGGVSWGAATSLVPVGEPEAVSWTGSDGPLAGESFAEARQMMVTIGEEETPVAVPFAIVDQELWWLADCQPRPEHEQTTATPKASPPTEATKQEDGPTPPAADEEDQTTGSSAPPPADEEDQTTGSPAPPPADEDQATGAPAPPAGDSPTSRAGGAITGTVTVFSTLRPKKYADDNCWTTGGYSDIGPGTQVRIEDGGGELLALSRLGAPYEKDPLGTGDGYVTCHWDFGPVQVPYSAFYTVTVSQRAGPTMTHSEMQTDNWDVFLYLGS